MLSITYETLSSLILAHQFLTPSTQKSGKKDVIEIIKSVGGLQWGAEDMSLLSRLQHFEMNWIDEAIEKKELIEVHVLRGGLRIITPEDYPYLFAATREAIERLSDRRLVPLKKMTDDHEKILYLLKREGPLTRKEIKLKIALPRSDFLVNELLVEGKIIRAGRKKNLVLIDTLENWLPGMDLENVDLGASRLKMGEKFLTIYGPSTASELAHWAGWSLTRGREVLSHLMEKGLITEVTLEGSPRFMGSGTQFPPRDTIPYLRLLHNDDEVHLACSGRCTELFGFDWKYRFSTTAAVLQNNRIVGEIEISKRKNTLSIGRCPPGVDTTMLSEYIERLAELWHAIPDWKG